MSPKPTCCWINHSDFTRPHDMYCGAPVSYSMKKDEDGSSFRVYDNWCAKHKKMADAQKDDEPYEPKR